MEEPCTCVEGRIGLCGACMRSFSTAVAADQASVLDVD